MEISVGERLLSDAGLHVPEVPQSPKPAPLSKPAPHKTEGRRSVPGGAPPAPKSVEETGLNPKLLGGLVLKSVYLLGLETNIDIARHLKLSQVVADELLMGLKQQAFLEVHGSSGGNVPVLHYGLTKAGKDLAIDACKLCQYVGPAPVTLTAFQDQVRKQSIQGEHVTFDDISAALSHLVLPQRLIHRLGPAVNSSRSMLVYGPPGNGKTSISEAIGGIFKQPIYIPHCFEVDGQIIRMFDPTIHTEIPSPDGAVHPEGEERNLLSRKPDARWVKCRRPVVLMGGELTLDMLDLDFDTNSKFYEAPPQVKALGGVFIIDDFGRQLVRPKDLLNRWVVPLERRVDYLTIHTGKKFDIPFDELVIFSTNLAPDKLMDAALLRRVKYKFRIDPPNADDYVKIFRRVCSREGIDLPQPVLSYLMEDFYPRTGIPHSGFHPGFFVEHAIAACRFEGLAPRLSIELIKDGIENLFVITDAPAREAPNPVETLIEDEFSQ